MQLEGAAIFGCHHDDGFVDQTMMEGEGLLTDANGFHEYQIEAATIGVGCGLFENFQASAGGGGKTAGLAARGETAHEDAVILGVDHRGAVAKQCAFADDAGIVRENGDAGGGMGGEVTQYEFIHKSGFAGATGAGDANDVRGRTRGGAGRFTRRILGTREEFSEGAIGNGSGA